MSEPFDQGFDSTADSGVPESSSPASTDIPISDATSESADNPAWNPALSGIPDVFHGSLKNHFKKWDDNYRGLESKYQELEGRYKPYEPYTSVDPQFLANGLNLLNSVNKNPLEVYNMLQEHLRNQGLLPGDVPVNRGQQVPDEQQQYESLENEDPRYTELDQRTRALDERQRQMDQFIQEQEQSRMVATYEGQIDKQVQSLIQKYGKETVDIDDLMQRMLFQVTSGKNYDAEAAFQEQRSFFQRMYQKSANAGKPAPQILSPTGTPAPSGEMSPAQMNEDQRKAYFKQLLDVANAGG